MAFTYKLEHEDGTPAEPSTFRTAVPNWRAATRSRSAATESSASSTRGSMKARTVTPVSVLVVEAA
jgi:hypothetical protein